MECGDFGLRLGVGAGVDFVGADDFVFVCGVCGVVWRDEFVCVFV